MGIEDRDTYQNLDLETWLQEEELMQQLVHQHLLRAQTKMKHQADSKRSFRQFSIGDSVYLKIQPYIQTSLSFRFSVIHYCRQNWPYRLQASFTTHKLHT
jgi:hypothetical protein